MWPSAYLYTYDWALYFVQRRKRYKARRCYTKLNAELESKIIELLKQYLSPKQISGYLNLHHDISISHETIYRFVKSDSKRKDELKPYLRQGKRTRRKKYGSRAKSSLIPNRQSIETRPKVVENKSRIGDWECDTIISQDRKSVLVTLVERKSLFTLTCKITRKTAAAVSKAIIKLLKPYRDKVKTLTFDNGSEFCHHEKIAEALSAKTYFANPYSSWERGINENTNGLLRQFFPKGTDFVQVTAKEVKAAMENLNNRPRKTTKYLTPNEIFKAEFIPLI
jgi:IS30 family transposase